MNPVSTFHRNQYGIGKRDLRDIVIITEHIIMLTGLRNGINIRRLVGPLFKSFIGIKVTIIIGRVRIRNKLIGSRSRNIEISLYTHITVAHDTVFKEIEPLGSFANFKNFAFYKERLYLAISGERHKGANLCRIANRTGSRNFFPMVKTRPIVRSRHNRNGISSKFVVAGTQFAIDFNGSRSRNCRTHVYVFDNPYRESVVLVRRIGRTGALQVEIIFFTFSGAKRIGREATPCGKGFVVSPNIVRQATFYKKSVPAVFRRRKHGPDAKT